MRASIVDYNECVDIQTLKTIKNNFLVDLKQAVSGKQTSLPFIRHHLGKATLLQSGEIFQAVVVGGNICQRALMKKVGNQFHIIKHSQRQQEPLLTKTDLMILLEKNIYPEVEVVTINFAYPLTPVLRKGMSDGVLQSGTKENPLNGLVGMQIGEEFEKYMSKVHGRTIRVVVANDVVCLLLSGLISHTWDAIAAGVVGT